MSEGAAEGGSDAGGSAPISDAQFGDVGDTPDTPGTGGETAQNPGDGLFMYGFYPYGTSQYPNVIKARAHARSRRKRKHER